MHRLDSVFALNLIVYGGGSPSKTIAVFVRESSVKRKSGGPPSDATATFSEFFLRLLLR